MESRWHPSEPVSPELDGHVRGNEESNTQREAVGERHRQPAVPAAGVPMLDLATASTLTSCHLQAIHSARMPACPVGIACSHCRFHHSALHRVLPSMTAQASVVIRTLATTGATHAVAVADGSTWPTRGPGPLPVPATCIESTGTRFPAETRDPPFMRLAHSYNSGERTWANTSTQQQFASRQHRHGASSIQCCGDLRCKRARDCCGSARLFGTQQSSQYRRGSGGRCRHCRFRPAGACGLLGPADGGGRRHCRTIARRPQPFGVGARLQHRSPP